MLSVLLTIYTKVLVKWYW